MSLSYYQILSISYLTAVGLWWVFASVGSTHIAPNTHPPIERPWLKSALMILCALCTIGIGSAYSARLLIPDFTIGSFRLGESINQALIYSPFPLYLAVTGESYATAWLPRPNWQKRLVAGILISFLALGVFIGLSGARSIGDVVMDVFHFQNAHHAVQVFFEDLAISMFLARLSGALGKKYFVLAIVVVALAFPLAHLPSDLSSGLPLSAILSGLLNDALLVFVIGFALYRFKDFLWLFPLHFTMDMMQFYSGITIHS